MQGEQRQNQATNGNESEIKPGFSEIDSLQLLHFCFSQVVSYRFDFDCFVTCSENPWIE